MPCVGAFKDVLYTNRASKYIRFSVDNLYYIELNDEFEAAKKKMGTEHFFPLLIQ